MIFKNEELNDLAVKFFITFGVGNQVDKFLEELVELEAAVWKVRNKGFSENTVKEMIGEILDVLFLCAQFLVLPNRKEFEQIMENKIKQWKNMSV